MGLSFSPILAIWVFSAEYGHTQSCCGDPELLGGNSSRTLEYVQCSLCVSFTTTTVCFASVIVVENISCILYAWAVPVTGHRLPYLLVYSHSIILWAGTNLQLLEYFGPLPSFLARRYTDSL